MKTSFQALLSKNKYHVMELILSIGHIVTGLFGFGIDILVTFYIMKKKEREKIK